MYINTWLVSSVIFIVIAAGILLGYLFIGGKVKSTRNKSELEPPYDFMHNQSLLRQEESKRHTLELEHNRIKTQLLTEKENRVRLENELDCCKKREESLNHNVNKEIELRHNLEKKNGGMEINIRGLEDSLKSLKDQYNTLEQRWYDSVDTIDGLKNDISQQNQKVEILNAQKKEIENRLYENKEQLREIENKKEEMYNAHKDLQNKYTELRITLEERNASHAREVSSFEKQKDSLKDHFRQLSNEILEAKAKSLENTGNATLSAAIAPFQQSMESFKKEIRDINYRETTQRGELRQELASLKELNHKITKEAHELSLALRGQKKLQGNWGELILENVLERSGLELGKDYDREVSIQTEDGRKRPDAIVYLPQNKHLIIDAKVSLNAYTRYINAENDSEKSSALKEHVQSVGNRIKELAERDYDKLPGLNSPDIVFMFIPIESAFIEALKADERLFQNAINNHVLVATPTTLLTSLNIVRQIWRYEHQSKHTVELANKADAVFNKLRSFLNSFETLKKGLDTAVDAYGKAEGQLVNGRGNLVKQVGDFKKIVPSIKTELPQYFNDKASLELATESSELPEEKLQK